VKMPASSDAGIFLRHKMSPGTVVIYCRNSCHHHDNNHYNPGHDAMNFTPQSVACFWLGWFAYSIAMSLIGGWHSLARRFAATAAPAGKRWHFVSGSVAHWAWLPMQYHVTFFLTLSEEGFRLSVFLPVRLMHPPLQIPWTAVSHMRTEPFLLLFRQTCVEIKGSPVKLRLRGRAGKALLEYYVQQSSPEAAIPANC
jgi:hypothetical protein